jgi:hypothetical protein
MRALVERYQKSGMGPTQFAATQGVSLYQLKYWIKKLKKEKASSSGFIQLNPSPANRASHLVEIEYPNGIKIKLTTSDFSFVSQLISL